MRTVALVVLAIPSAASALAQSASPATSPGTRASASQAPSAGTTIERVCLFAYHLVERSQIGVRSSW